MEAITSRPLLAAVGKAVTHANQITLYLTPLHGRAIVLEQLIVKYRRSLSTFQGGCGAVQGHGSMGLAAALYLRADRFGNRASEACPRLADYGATAGFGVIQRGVEISDEIGSKHICTIETPPAAGDGPVGDPHPALHAGAAPPATLHSAPAITPPRGTPICLIESTRSTRWAGTDQEPGRRFKRSVHVGAGQPI